MSPHSQPITIHQYHPYVADGDAITHQMRFLQNSFVDAGIESQIFAHHIPSSLQTKVRPFRSNRIWDCDLLLLHHSQGNRYLNQVLRVSPPKALVYHNITPKKFLEHDPHLKRLSELGRRQLSKIRDHVQANFTVSDYNAEELKHFGFLSTLRLPLLDLEKATKLIAPLQRPKWQQSKSLLFVGRLTRHKNQACLIKTLYYLNKNSPHPWQLILVGSEDRIYGPYLRGLAQSLQLQSRVLFTGKISQTRLHHYYHTADAFVCASEHEGFCVPLVEAMKAELPIFARPLTGVAETLDKAGIQCHTDQPHILAEILRQTLADPTILDHVLAGQARQLATLTQKQNAATAVKACRKLVQQLRKPQSEKEAPYAPKENTRSPNPL